MSELTERVRGGFDSDGSYLGNPRYVKTLCDEHERLEAEHDRLGVEGVHVVNELRRLEGLLLALGSAEIARRKVVEENVWKDRSEYFRAVDDAIHAVCDEAVRLAKVKP